MTEKLPCAFCGGDHFHDWKPVYAWIETGGRYARYSHKKIHAVEATDPGYRGLATAMLFEQIIELHPGGPATIIIRAVCGAVLYYVGHDWFPQLATDQSSRERCKNCSRIVARQSAASVIAAAEAILSSPRELPE